MPVASAAPATPSPGFAPAMKLSMFASFIPYRGKILGFNALSDSFVLMERHLWERLDGARNEDGFDRLADALPAMVRGLVDNGFLVPAGKDELAEVKAISRAADNDDSFYHIILNSTMSCNFSCWYCYEAHEKKSRVSPANLERIKRHISRACESRPNLKALHLSWFGGEPLMEYERTVVPVSEHCRGVAAAGGIDFSSSYTTNGYLLREEMLDAFKRYNTVSFQITLDGHRANHDRVRFAAGRAATGPRGSYDRILANIVMLARSGLNVALRINYTKDNIDDIEAIAADLKAAGVSDADPLAVSLHRVWQAEEIDPAAVRQKMQRLQESGFRSDALFTHGKAITDPCYADKRNQVTINYNGDVFKCTAREFSEENREGVLGDDGEIDWGGNLETRMDLKFKNPPCLKCRVLPLCNGGCTQVMKENIGRDYCIYKGSEAEKDAVVISRFEYLQNFKPKLNIRPDTVLSGALLA
jgi:uncharacterized protein